MLTKWPPPYFHMIVSVCRTIIASNNCHIKGSVKKADASLARYMFAMEYYTAVWKDEIMQFASLGMKLETILLNKVNRKDRLCQMISLIYRTIKDQKGE